MCSIHASHLINAILCHIASDDGFEGNPPPVEVPALLDTEPNCNPQAPSLAPQDAPADGALDRSPSLPLPEVFEGPFRSPTPSPSPTPARRVRFDCARTATHHQTRRPTPGSSHSRFAAKPPYVDLAAARPRRLAPAAPQASLPAFEVRPPHLV